MRFGFLLLSLVTGFLPALFLWVIGSGRRKSRHKPGIVESFVNAYNDQEPHAVQHDETP